MLPLGHPASTSWTGGAAGWCARRLVTRQPVYLGGYSTGHCGRDDSPSARDEPDNLPAGSRGSDTPGVSVTGGILSPVLPAGISLPMPWGLFHHLNCIHCWTVVE